MKKFIFALTALALFMGCTKEKELNPETTPSGTSEMVTYVFQASMADDETRATIADNGDFSWSANDEIAVYNTKDSQFYTFSCESGDGIFEGTAPADAEFSVSYYPASIATSETSVTLPVTYSQAEAVAGRSFPMRAEVAGTSLSFEHLGALMKVSLKDVPANATSMTLSSDYTVAGAFTPALAGGKYQISTASGASEITISLSNASKQDLALYVPLPTGTYGYTITLGSSDIPAMLEKSTTSAKTIERASLHLMKELTVEYPTTSFKLQGAFTYASSEHGWSDDAIALTAVDGQYGWYKVANVGMLSGHAVFKFTDGTKWKGVYPPVSGDLHQIANVLISVGNTNSDPNYDIYASSALDIYFNVNTDKVFALSSGSAFAVPTLTLAHADSYLMTGKYGTHNWDGSNEFVELVSGHDDWRVFKNVAAYQSAAANGFSVKFRNNFDWSDAFGVEASSSRAVGKVCTTGGNDYIVNDGTSTAYDIYIKSDCSQVFAVTKDAGFAPTSLEAMDGKSITGQFRINNTNNDWGTDVSFNTLVEGSLEWLVLKGVSRSTALGDIISFKLRNTGSWDTTWGLSSSLSQNPGWFDLTKSNSQNCNIRVGDTEVVDIYIKSDLSKIGIIKQGSSVVLPD